MRVRTPAIRCDRPTIQGLPAFSPAQCPRVGGKLILPQRTFRVMLKTTRVCVSTWGRTSFQNAVFKLSQAPALAQAGVVGRPVRDLAPLPGNVGAAVLVQLERQGGHPRSDEGRRPTPPRPQPQPPSRSMQHSLDGRLTEWIASSWSSQCVAYHGRDGQIEPGNRIRRVAPSLCRPRRLIIAPRDQLHSISRYHACAVIRFQRHRPPITRRSTIGSARHDLRLST